ncbi:high mobility group B protein 6 [Tanacetum coccineum]
MYPDLEGKANMNIRALEMVEEFRTQRADKQVQTLNRNTRLILKRIPEKIDNEAALVLYNQAVMVVNFRLEFKWMFTLRIVVIFNNSEILDRGINWHNSYRRLKLDFLWKLVIMLLGCGSDYLIAHYQRWERIILNGVNVTIRCEFQSGYFGRFTLNCFTSLCYSLQLLFKKLALYIILSSEAWFVNLLFTLHSSGISYEIAKITEEWKNMTEKQKAPYEKVVKQKNKKYTQEMEVYKQNKKEDELLKVLKQEAYFRIELWKNQESFGDLLHSCKFFTSCLRMQSRIRETCPLGRNQKYKSRSNRYCGRYQQLIKVTHAWTVLPRGVKFDPLDHEIIWHLLAKSGFEAAASCGSNAKLLDVYRVTDMRSNEKGKFEFQLRLQEFIELGRGADKLQAVKYSRKHTL